MQETIREKARELGRLLSQTSEYQQLKQARRRLEGHEEARELVQRLSKSHQEVLGYLERGEEPPEDVRTRYEEAFQTAQGHPAYQSLVAAQENLDKIMQKINEEISRGVEAGDQSRIILPS